jgi:hypothetical protein
MVTVRPRETQCLKRVNECETDATTGSAIVIVIRLASPGPAGIEIRVIGVDHGQLPEHGLLHMEVAVFTPCEVPLDVP